jgi:hypothetical protein
LSSQAVYGAGKTAQKVGKGVADTAAVLFLPGASD